MLLQLLLLREHKFTDCASRVLCFFLHRLSERFGIHFIEKLLNIFWRGFQILNHEVNHVARFMDMSMLDDRPPHFCVELCRLGVGWLDVDLPTYVLEFALHLLLQVGVK